MDIRISGQLEGAKTAKGLAVIIDVFRAFTVECFLAEEGVAKIIPMGNTDECLALRAKHPDYYLVGERKGIKLPDFDSGNSPSFLTTAVDLKGRTIVHNTSAGTQGIMYASKSASEVLGASLVNADAVARYIKMRNPDVVTLVCMGLNGTEESAEDTLCAKYIKAKLLGEELNIHKEIADLKNTAGSKFFDKARRSAFPEPDFFMCLVPDIFNFVLKANTSIYPFEMEKIEVPR